jgi:hypothetical protein
MLNTMSEPFGDELRGLEGTEILCSQARIELAQQITLGSLASDFRIAGFIRDARNRVLHPLGIRRTDDRAHVMHGLGVSGAHFGCNDPCVFREVCFHENAFVVDRAGGGKLNVHRHFDNHVRLEVPSFMERARCRRIFGIAFESPVVSPGDQCLDVAVAERSVVGEMTVRGIRKPWRHLA